MSRSHVRRILAVAAALLVAPWCAGAQTHSGATVFTTPNLVTDGSFEAVQVTSGTHWALSGDPTRPEWGMNVPAGFGWRVTGSVDIHNFVRSGWVATSNGVQTLELNGNGVADPTVTSGVWQEIATTAGTRYTLQFLLSDWNANQAVVWWNGAALDAALDASPSSGTANLIGSTSNGFSIWEFRDLIATQPTTTLGFTTLAQNSAHGPIIDDVRLYAQPAVVPEPSTTALLATGVAGLGVVARRRRRG